MFEDVPGKIKEKMKQVKKSLNKASFRRDRKQEKTDISPGHIIPCAKIKEKYLMKLLLHLPCREV